MSNFPQPPRGDWIYSTSNKVFSLRFWRIYPKITVPFSSDSAAKTGVSPYKQGIFLQFYPLRQLSAGACHYHLHSFTILRIQKSGLLRNVESSACGIILFSFKFCVLQKNGAAKAAPFVQLVETCHSTKYPRNTRGVLSVLTEVSSFSL